MKRFLLLVVICIGWQACQEPSSKGAAPYPVEVNSDPRTEPRLFFQVDSLLPRVDSVVAVFFDDPFGPDSLRYTRYYKQTEIKDSSAIQGFIQPLNVAVTASETKRNCRIEGKIWCYANRRLVQTLYWSGGTGDCRFQYLIRDGLFYYVHLTPSQQQLLEKWKQLSVKPPTDTRG